MLINLLWSFHHMCESSPQPVHLNSYRAVCCVHLTETREKSERKYKVTKHRLASWCDPLQAMCLWTSQEKCLGLSVLLWKERVTALPGFFFF